MERRRFLGAITAGTTLIAGCSQGGQDIQDSDGDGVIDSEDYAPNDPAVQAKSDLQTTTQTPRPTTTESSTTPATTVSTTSTPAPTTTTTSTTTTAPTADNIIQVTDDYWQETSHIEAYNATTVRGVVTSDYPSTNYDQARVYVGLYAYPSGRLITDQHTAAFDRAGGQSRFDAQLELFDPPTNERLHYGVALLPAGQTIDEAASEEITWWMETDPFEIDADGSVRRSPHPDALGDESGTGYERDAIEGDYRLELSGRTNGRDWTVSFLGSKSGYINTLHRSRGRSRPEYVSYELTEGVAPALASILDDEAEANGFTDKREKVEMIIDVVQRFPYVPDDVSTGFDDYTKFITETFTEMGGDCEDTSILLAAVLEAEPFNYDMILIQPPGHMAVGILGTEDLRGDYWPLDGNQYYYIETTGEGWGIGNAPDEYQGVDALLHQV